jgi:DNA-binding transcriptional MerR regulator/methylmalonyl-CoA mutase cobalamin-binding subunit
MERDEAGNGTSLHPIGVVAERTGLSLDVLRVWERRYGVVQPTRDEGGRRLYSDADIERLRLLAEATSGGRAIRQVAGLPVERLRELVREDAAGRWTVARGAAARRAPAEDFVERAMERTRALDGSGLESGLRQAASLLGLIPFLEEVVPAFARRIGDAWHAGQLTIAQEHLATGVLRPLLSQLRAALPTSPEAPGLLVAAPAGERHELGALLVAAAAAAEGARVTYLGTDVPAAEIASAAHATRARAVALSTVYPADPEALAAELGTLRARLTPEIPILVGGAGLARLGPLADVALVPIADLAGLRSWLAAGGLVASTGASRPSYLDTAQAAG